MDVDTRTPTKASLRDGSSDEHLPLYEEFQVSEANGNVDQLPRREATPDEVRDFLASLLTIKRSLPSDHVRRIAAKWTVGTGTELRSYPASMYLDIFGREDGWITYREVKLVQEGEKRFAQRYTGHLITAILIVFEAILLIVGAILKNDGQIVTNIIAVFVAFPLAAALIILFCSYVWPDTPEKSIERILGAAVSSTRTGTA